MYRVIGVCMCASSRGAMIFCSPNISFFTIYVVVVGFVVAFALSQHQRSRQDFEDRNYPVLQGELEPCSSHSYPE